MAKRKGDNEENKGKKANNKRRRIDPEEIGSEVLDLTEEKYKDYDYDELLWIADLKEMENGNADLTSDEEMEEEVENNPIQGQYQNYVRKTQGTGMQRGDR